MKFYKVLGKGGVACNGGSGKWNLPKNGEPGEWMPKIEKIKPCVKGYHLCREDDLLEWLNEEIYEAEGRGRSIRNGSKDVFPEARLLRKLDSWNEKTARLFAADCAERVLFIFERIHPNDDRPRTAIQAARDFANGKTDRCSGAAAGDAGDAAGDAGDAAWAARAAACAAGDAGAVWAAARAAACAAGATGTGAAERQWQKKRLKYYLCKYKKPGREVKW